MIGIIFDRQHGSTVKAVRSLERCCPIMSVAPALAIVCMVAALSLQKGEHDPAGEIVSVSLTGSNRVDPNSEGNKS